MLQKSIADLAALIMDEVMCKPCDQYVTGCTPEQVITCVNAFYEQCKQEGSMYERAENTTH